MASFFIPLTGLESDSTALNTIANDLSNMNTTAFKGQSTNFSDLFYQQIGATGSGDPIELGAGVKVSSNETTYSQGSINATGNATDVAINGNGFFVIAPTSGGQEFTRAGDFSLTSTGALVTSGGGAVMGYPAVNGVVNTNAPLSAINIPVGQVEQPKATTSMNMTLNIDSASPANTVFPTDITVYDSLGDPHTASITYAQTGINTWGYSVALPAADFANGVSVPVTGTMAFDANGNLSTITPAGGAATGVVERPRLVAGPEGGNDGHRGLSAPEVAELDRERPARSHPFHLHSMDWPTRLETWPSPGTCLDRAARPPSARWTLPPPFRQPRRTAIRAASIRASRSAQTERLPRLSRTGKS